MRPLSFPMLPPCGEHPRVYRFDMPFPAQGALGSCRVDIYDCEVLAPGSPLTVVVGDTPGCHGPSPTTYIERVCSLVWHVYLVPLRLASQPARWVQRLAPGLYANEQWSEIHFKGLPGGFENPAWIPTGPVHLIWDRLLGETCSVDEIRLVNPLDICDDDLVFTPDECHREFTGVCSLEDPMPSGLGSGQAEWRHCRQLARMGEVWRLMVQYVGPERSMAELDIRALEVDGELWRYIEQNWHSDSGCVPEILPMAIRAAASSFGPRQSEPVAISGTKPYELTNGRHRACVARRLGLPLCGTITVQRARRLSGDDN